MFFSVYLQNNGWLFAIRAIKKWKINCL